MPERRDSADHHVARWVEYWKDSPQFDAAVEGAITRIGSVNGRRRRMDAAAFAGSDFSLEDFHTLHALMVQPYPGEATPAQLAEILGVTRAAVTSRLDRLVDGGLITREVDALDRRRVIVRPTPAGRKAWDKYVFEGMAREQQLFAALNEREMQQLNRLLRKMMLSFEDT